MTTDPFFLHVSRPASDAAAEFAIESWTVQAAQCRMAVERALPDSSVELYFNLGPAGRHLSEEKPRLVLPHRAAWVVGPHARPLDIEKETRDCHIVAIRLMPWAVRRVLGVPASELRASMIDLEVLWGSGVDETRERLNATTHPSDRLAIVEDAVTRQAARRRPMVDARVARELCRAATADASLSIAELSSRYGLTHRRVIEVFDTAVGLKPKEFHRVARLRRVFHMVDAHPRPTWTSIAHQCGYFDQAHLINDFRLLTGITPAEYVSTRSSVGHGFIPRRLAAT